MNRCLLAALCLLGCSTALQADQPVDFQREVRPILSDKCIQCHGPDDEHREADLRLDMAPAAGEEFVIAPGKPDKSEMIRRILATDPDEHMPPAKSGKDLTPAEVATLRRWIEQGANWSMHWAYVPPVKHEPPAVKNTNWSQQPIDRFILARLERAGFQPAPPADRVTLIRRLSFDLRGLPPTVQEVTEFVADKTPQAVEKVIDRYLASDAFGERMAMYWLDLVRYADTVGYHGDQEHHISPYRDWVIDAFIADMPFDQFTREQLAGDLVPNSDMDQKIASGYNRLLQTSHEGGVQEKEYLAMYFADRVRNVSGVWFGATVGCAQCHNHKFDPYTAKDFYALGAFFSDLDEAQHLRKGKDISPALRPPEMKVHSARERQQLAELEAKIDKLQEQDTENDVAVGRQVAELEKQKTQLEKAARLTMISVAIAPRTIRILPRGNWLDDSGTVVSPAIPAFLGVLNIGDKPATRLDLANWLTDAERGGGLLTARVMANRFWYLMFGNGLSRSLEDFGGQGAPPDHPELLDRLAGDFVEAKWSTKRLLKQIAMSQTYQQSSVPSVELASKDPDNRLYGRQGRFRLPAEMIRDNALAVSGLLVTQLGGPSVHPYQPAGYYKHLNFPKRDYTADKDQRQWRRGVYVHWQRQFLHPMMKAFDAPRREECVPQRSRSNTPLAALALLNDPSFVEAARAFAAQTMAVEGAECDRIDHAFLEATSRKPDDYERKVLEKLLGEARREFRSDPDAAKKLLATGISPQASDLDAADLAAWTTVCRAILNLSETVTRN